MTLTPWQRANILAALNYLKDIGAHRAESAGAGCSPQGLMEVLEPSRRTIRLQREAAQAATAGAQSGRERRTRRARGAIPIGASSRPSHTVGAGTPNRPRSSIGEWRRSS